MAPKKGRKIYIFDTTLRDGEQSPGASLTPDEKLRIAKQLERLNVDVIEAGFPASSPGERAAVKMISAELRKPVICGLSRMVPKDIDACREALEKAKRKRLHVFLATSQIHRQFKLKKGKSEILRMAVENIKSARKDFKDIEFSPEDAARTEPKFLSDVVSAAIDAGARHATHFYDVFAPPPEMDAGVRPVGAVERIPRMVATVPTGLFF